MLNIFNTDISRPKNTEPTNSETNGAVPSNSAVGDEILVNPPGDGGADEDEGKPTELLERLLKNNIKIEEQSSKEIQSIRQRFDLEVYKLGTTNLWQHCL